MQDIPKAFVREHSLSYKTNEKMILRTSSNSHWEANIIQKNDSRTFLSRGWRAFLYENCLTAGDICTFEFLNRLELMVHVVTRKELNIENKVNPSTSLVIPSQRADLDHGNYFSLVF